MENTSVNTKNFVGNVRQISMENKSNATFIKDHFTV